MWFQRVVFIVLAFVAVLGPCSMVALGTLSQDASDLLNRATADFLSGRIERSVAGFDQVVELAPEMAPYLWQRGIALYYMGRYDDCRAQFESHRTVNPNDVENAAWHFLCFARLQSPEEARKALLPVGHDSREPMMTIYKVFRGENRPEELLPVIQGHWPVFMRTCISVSTTRPSDVRLKPISTSRSRPTMTMELVGICTA